MPKTPGHAKNRRPKLAVRTFTLTPGEQNAPEMLIVTQLWHRPDTQMLLFTAEVIHFHN
jgi:hypothetical protein